jgi:hypothetical protein
MLIELSLMVLNLTPLLFVLSPDPKIVETLKLKGKLTKFLIFHQLLLSFFILGDKNRISLPVFWKKPNFS